MDVTNYEQTTGGFVRTPSVFTKQDKNMTRSKLNFGPAVLAFAMLGGSSAAVRAADTLSVGANAPAFSVPDQNGKTHTLAQDKGKVVLLAFYPADFTGGCTIEAHSLTAANKDLTALGVKVYGVSVQDSKSHQGFCTKEGITYTLLADTQKQMAKSYGVLSDNGAVAKRVTYIIGKDGKVAYVDPSVNSHLLTAGADWVKWIKEHPAQVSTADTPGLPVGVAAISGKEGTSADGGPASIQNFKNTAADTPASTGPTLASLGKRAPSFTLANVSTGARTSLDSLRQGKKATVLMFVSTRCPISNGYTERITALVNKYGAEGVSFVAINANSNEPVSECKQHAAENKFAFPVLKDAGNKVADAYDARVTPETYVIDAAGSLVYHGRIDNDVDPAFVKTHDLAAALDSVLAGRSVAKPTAKAFGCSIKRVQ